VKVGKKITQGNGPRKQAGVAIIKSDIEDFRIKLEEIMKFTSLS
jgi:hypothetical protein